MAVPYESTGRRRQKARTRQALVEATRTLLTQGGTPTVEAAAEQAGVSRTTAYRYFPNQGTLLAAAYPEIEERSLLPHDAPADAPARLDRVLDVFIDEITVGWAPQLRAQLRVSLEPGAPQPALRGGRAIGWIEDALHPLADSHPEVDVHRLALAIRSATGIEALVWLTDIAGLDPAAAAKLMRWSATAMVQAAMAGNGPPA